MSLYIRQRMQETLYQTEDARDSISDNGCRSRCMQVSLYQTADEIAGSLCKRPFFQTADTRASLSDSGCRSLYIKQRMKETLIEDSGCRVLYIIQRMQESIYQTAVAGVSLSDSGCKWLYQTADAGVSISNSGWKTLIEDSGCRVLYIIQRMQESIYQTAVAGVSLSDSGCKRLYIRQQMQETL